MKSKTGLSWFLAALRQGPALLQLFPPGSERYATRSLEAYLAVMDILFGVLVVLPMWDTMEPGIYARLLDIIPNEAVWGAILAGRGLLHAIALRINGRAWWTPFARAACSGISAIFWCLFLVAILSAHPFVPGLVFSLAVVNVGAHYYCIRRSGRDARMARKALAT